MNKGVLAIIIFLAAYSVILTLIAPALNKKRMKKQEELREEYLSKIKAKDRIVTISGIYGTVKSIRDNIVKLEVAKNIEIEIDKASIMGTLK